MKKYSSNMATVAVCTLIATSAHAIYPGATLVNGSFTNPYTNQSTDAWKLVGSMTFPNGDNCSGVQISPEWVVASGHCSMEDTVIFKNYLSTDARGSTFTCRESGDSENGLHRNPVISPIGAMAISMCRLTNPERFAAPAAYPALTIAPYKSVGERPFGKELIVGYGSDDSSRNRLGRAAFGNRLSDGNDICSVLHPFYFAGQSSCISGWEGGDSGGGRFWFSPYATAPTLIGVIDGVSFTQPVLNWIQTRTNLYSSLAHPTVAAGSTAFGRPLTDAPGSLPQPPAIKVSGTSVTVSWQVPALATGEAIDDYRVYEGPGVLNTSETLERDVSVPFSATPSTVLTGVALGQRKVCVQPRRFGMEASPNRDVNCTYYNNIQPVATNIVVTSTAASTTLRNIRLNWGVQGSGSGVGYKISYTIRYPSGPAKSGSADLTTTSWNLGLATKGGQLCGKVTAYTSIFDGVPTTIPCVVLQ